MKGNQENVSDTEVDLFPTSDTDSADGGKNWRDLENMQTICEVGI